VKNVKDPIREHNKRVEEMDRKREGNPVWELVKEITS